MDKYAFIYLFNRFFIQFKNQKFLNNHKLHMDNATSHEDGFSTEYFKRKNVNHFKTPAQSQSY